MNSIIKIQRHSRWIFIIEQVYVISKLCPDSPWFFLVRFPELFPHTGKDYLIID